MRDPTPFTPPRPAAPQTRSSRWIKAQALSGLVFALFVALHLSTHVAAIFGPEAYAKVQAITRLAYRPAYLELAFAIALVVHMAAAVVRLRNRRREPSGGAVPVPARLRWHRIGGWFLFAVIAAHVGATRGLTAWQDIELGFGGLSFAMAWMPLVFWIYYLALALFGLYHAAHGSVLAWGRLGALPPARLRRGLGFWGPVGAMACAMVLALAALSGWLFEIPDPFDNDYARVYSETMGETMGLTVRGE